jgi:hypothetical protein
MINKVVHVSTSHIAFPREKCSSFAGSIYFAVQGTFLYKIFSEAEAIVCLISKSLRRLSFFFHFSDFCVFRK